MFWPFFKAFCIKTSMTLFNMCICSTSCFLDARPSSENCRRIQHERSHDISFHGIETRAPCCFGPTHSYNSAFLKKPRFRVKPSEDEHVLVLVDSSSAENHLIQLVGENDSTSSKGFKQMTKRSNLVAKQVISIQSALSLGFISQLWVDTTSWLVLVVDVKPSLLSGESDRFLLKDIARVGDVVLVKDESVLDTEFKMFGLETLVGYRVVTRGGRNIGKVRGYSFNINSGIVESLELDSFGVTIIPSSLVSTYRLDVEDIIEVLEDVVVVYEDAASKKQRLTKGLWDAQFGSEYSDVEELESSSERRRQRRSTRSSRKKRDFDDDEWTYSANS